MMHNEVMTDKRQFSCQEAKGSEWKGTGRRMDHGQGTHPSWKQGPMRTKKQQKLIT